MNIFILDENPVNSARMLCDKHVVKMFSESCQMLANAFTLEELKSAPKTITGNFRKHSYLHHPCSKWVLESYSNYVWLLHHAMALAGEYRLRYNKIHFTYNFFLWAAYNSNIIRDRLPHKGLTPFSQAMPEQYKNENAVVAYRNYYIGEKLKFAKWNHSKIPAFITQLNLKGDGDESQE